MREFFKRMLKSRALAFAGAVLLVLTGAAVTAMMLSAHGGRGMVKAKSLENHESGFIIAKPGTYDSEDTAVIEKIDGENGSVTLMNIETGRSYTLSFDGTTVIMDRHGGSMSMSQMRPGGIVDVDFLRGKKKLVQMKLSESAWVYENLEKYDFDIQAKSATIGGERYGLRGGAVILSEDREAQLEDIIRGDVVTVSGIDHTIYSIIVEQGHGYLRLSDAEYLKGGWIEVGQKVIQQITEDMLLPVPEGTWDVRLTAEGIDETKRVSVGRNKEVVLDVSEVKAEEPKTGKILFAVTPDTAKVYIDGQETDTSSPVELEYGIHQMIAKAEGYDSITRYIKVGQELASLSVSLEETQEDEERNEDVPSSSVSGNELTSYYKVYIDSPSDVEVYVDGIYKGMSPVNFRKEAGTHTITLRKKGYETKSYTVQIDDEDRDVTFSFTGLIKSEESSVSGNSSGTVSGNSQNTVSGNGSNGSQSNTASGNGTASGNSVSGN